MIQTAILGHGTVGSGVAEILINHNALVCEKVKDELSVKYILELRDFSSLPYADKFTNDFEKIINDGEVKIVAEVMGGIHPAYEFVKAADNTSAILSVSELEGYTFEGWYSDKAFNIRFDTNSLITEDITIYAKWKKNSEPEKPTEDPGNKTEKETTEDKGKKETAEKEKTKTTEQKKPETTEKEQTVSKLANTMKVKGKTVTVKKSKLKKKTRKIKRSKAITIKKAKGTVTFKKIKGNKKIRIDKKTGKISVKKGLKKGSYKVKVKVTAAGNEKYDKLTETVTFTIKVK